MPPIFPVTSKPISAKHRQAILHRQVIGWCITNAELLLAEGKCFEEERDKHIKRVGYLASKLEKNGVFVIASFIAPYEETRRFVKDLCENSIEVYLSTPMDICEKRDSKGLYDKARKGEIKNFTGINDPYEAPEEPDIAIDTTNTNVEEAVKLVLKKIN